MHRPFQHQPVIAKPVTMIRAVDDNRVVGEAKFVEAIHQPPDLMIDQRDLAVGVGDDLTKLFVALLRDDFPAMPFFQFLGDHPGLSVGAAAGGKGNHHGDRT